MKCDEKRPSCNRCTRSGRICGAYVAKSTFVFEVDTKQTPIPLPYSVSLQEGNTFELRAFRHYVERTGPVLGDFILEARSFFNVAVPQASHSELTIRHMIIATASLHEAFYLHPSVSNKQRQLFQCHHNKAVALLTRSATSPAVEIVLMACLLFLACENFQGSVIVGSMHVRSGLKILRDRERCLSNHTNFTGNILQSVMKPIFARLEEQVSVLGASSQPVSASTRSRTTCNLAGELLASHLEIARNELLQIMEDVTARIPRLQKMVDNGSRVTELKDELTRWHQALQRSKAELANQDEILTRTIEELQVHQRVLLILLSALNSPTEAIYDDFLVDFHLIISDCEKLVKYGRTTDGRTRHTVGMSSRQTFGMIPPLFTLACRCRDPALRRQAVHILHGLRQREGIWDSCTAAQIAQAVISVEEQGLTVLNIGGDVTEHSRIRVVSADVRKGDLSTLALTISRNSHNDPQEVRSIWPLWSIGKNVSPTQWVRFCCFLFG